jgi:pimeloyl-ACP methyl ester carboxylesterase
MTTFNTVKVDGLDVFYREAGAADAPKLLLLGGFPSSSHQFRNLMPALADQFHLVAFDYPGFGNTTMPDPATWDYTFDHLTDIVDGALQAVGFTGPMGIYMQDYGGPIGNRLIERHPDWLEWQVIQNANTYEEGFTAAWDGIRHVLWANRSPETEAPLEAFLQPDTVKAIYLTGHPDPAKISPDNWNMDLFFLARQHGREGSIGCHSRHSGCWLRSSSSACQHAQVLPVEDPPIGTGARRPAAGRTPPR